MLSGDRSDRLAHLRLVLPKTREFLLALYGGESEYAGWTVPRENPYSLLETVCMMYDHSFEFPYSAVKALEILRDTPGSVCTMYGKCSSTCSVSCLCGRKERKNSSANAGLINRCGMDPRAQLHDELTRIVNSRTEIEKYTQRWR